MSIWEKLISLTPRKLNLAMLIMAVSCMATIIVFLFKSESKTKNDSLNKCEERLKQLEGNYSILNKQLFEARENAVKDVERVYKMLFDEMKNNQNKIDEIIERMEDKQERVNRIIQEL